MKLGELKAKIRTSKGNPSVKAEIGGATLYVVAQKTPLMASLDEAFGASRAVETGLMISDNGMLIAEGDEQVALTEATEIDDLDSLDDDDEIESL